MTPIPISPSDLAELLFGCVNERNAHVDEATYHWLRRPGAPAMDMPHKIIPPHIANLVSTSDPDGAWLHVQTVVAPHVTYHVLWERRHWLESNERVMQKFHAAREHREAFFTAKSAELAASSAHAARLAHMMQVIIACGVPRMKATMFVEQAWRDAANEEAFKAKIEGVENLFGITGIYKPPYETIQEQDQDTKATDGEASPLAPLAGEQTAHEADSQERQAGDADRAAEGGAIDSLASDRPRDAASGPADAPTTAVEATGTEPRGVEITVSVPL